MFCPNCGTQNGDNAAFCKNCGTNMRRSTVSDSQNNTQSQSQPNVQPPVMNTAVVRSNHPVLKIVKDMGASPVYLTAVIAFTASILFGFMGVFMRNFSPFYSLDRLLYQFGIYDASDILWQLDNSWRALSIVALIPSTIYTIGMWLVFAGAQQRGNNGMPTSGLTVIKIMEILYLVFSSITLAVVEIACLIGIVAALGAGSYSYYNGYYSASSFGAGIAAVLIALAIGILIGFVIVIIYHAKIISTINKVKRTILTGNADYKVSSYVAVMNFIIAFFSIFGIFSGGFMNLLSGLCGITALISFGILLFKYKSAMIGVLNPNARDALGYAQGYDVNTYNQNNGNYQP